MVHCFYFGDKVWILNENKNETGNKEIKQYPKIERGREGVVEREKLKTKKQESMFIGKCNQNVNHNQQ